MLHVETLSHSGGELLTGFMVAFCNAGDSRCDGRANDGRIKIMSNNSIVFEAVDVRAIRWTDGVPVVVHHLG